MLNYRFSCTTALHLGSDQEQTHGVFGHHPLLACRNHAPSHHKLISGLRALLGEKYKLAQDESTYSLPPRGVRTLMVSVDWSLTLDVAIHYTLESDPFRL